VGLRTDDQVALEATGNSDAIANQLTPLVGRVVVSNPSKTRAIAEAKVKTDKVDARILAQLLAADFLPPVWLPDERTRSLRRQVMRRAHLVRQRTRIKNLPRRTRLSRSRRGRVGWFAGAATLKIQRNVARSQQLDQGLTGRPLNQRRSSRVAMSVSC
jgi:transposase